MQTPTKIREKGARNTDFFARVLLTNKKIEQKPARSAPPVVVA